MKKKGIILLTSGFIAAAVVIALVVVSIGPLSAEEHTTT